MSIDLSIVIPCYNEEDRLPRTLTATISYLRARTGQYEIMVVSDGSKDRTKEVAEMVFKTLPQNIVARVIEYTPNGGKGKALKVGMQEAQGDQVLFMDADYAVPLEYLPPAELLLKQGVDIAIGSRAVKGTQVLEHQSFIREKMSKVFGLIQRNYLGLKLLDTQCGFKLFTKEASHRLFAQMKLTSVIFDGEVLWLAKRMDYKVVEFPVQWTHDQDSRITYNFVRTLKVFRDMIAIPFLHKGRAPRSH
jgi:dolichyl-phosphate beta-glucosyltransferase